jgi:carbonic anhydrase
MTRMTPLLARNEQFAQTYTPMALGMPAAQVLVVTCLDHRVDPAIVLGLQLGDAPVIRNAGGRVTQAVIDDVVYLAFLAEQLFGGQLEADRLFEVAVIHHTQCGTGFLADPGFRHQAAEATGRPEAALEASAVADPHATVKADVERLLAAPLLSPKVTVSGHVYDIATGRVTTERPGSVPGARMPAVRSVPGNPAAEGDGLGQHADGGAGDRDDQQQAQRGGAPRG